MSASATPVLDFVRDMERRGLPSFRHHSLISSYLCDLACDLRQAALAKDAAAVAHYIRKMRWERLWHIKKWLTCRYDLHPRIGRWVHEQLGMRPC